MTYDIYAIYHPGRAYKVAESTNSEHGMDVAERVCVDLPEFPHAFVSLARGVDKLNVAVQLYSLSDLTGRVGF